MHFRERDYTIIRCFMQIEIQSKISLKVSDAQDSWICKFWLVCLIFWNLFLHFLKIKWLNIKLWSMLNPKSFWSLRKIVSNYSSSEDGLQLKFVLISDCCFSWINPYLKLNFISTDSVTTREINSWCILFTYRLFLFIFGKTKVYFERKYTLL